MSEEERYIRLTVREFHLLTHALEEIRTGFILGDRVKVVCYLVAAQKVVGRPIGALVEEGWVKKEGKW